MVGTLITSEIDLEAQGKKPGELCLPHSVHRSADGCPPVPITVLQNGDGPTLAPTEVAAPYSGRVLCQRAMAQVRRGDALFQIAAEAG
ncbi:hypothetical protein [Aquicoccus sp. SU-CL01552]|uniref:hypothetical protein n=1 Tax=Aquicoccus sp. SU-CL01552 TaxID=3127656 RepID=UPI003102AADC